MAEATHVVTGKVRLSYVTLTEPKSIQGGEPKYSVTLLIPKSDTQTKTAIDRAIEAAKQRGLNDKFGGRIPPSLPTPIHDGDGPRPSDGDSYGAECRGCWVMAVTSRNKPMVVDTRRMPITDPSELYSGIYGRVSMDFYAYSGSKKGIGVSLGNVQKLADGEPLVSRATVDDDFGDDFADDEWDL